MDHPLLVLQQAILHGHLVCKYSNQPGDVSNLTEIFPHVSEENVKFVFALRLDSDDDVDDMVSAVITYYKGQEFDRLAQVRIYMRNGPSVDTGGVRRDFFTAVFEQIGTEKYRLFEGPSDRLRPVFRMSNVSSEMPWIDGCS